MFLSEQRSKADAYQLVHIAILLHVDVSIVNLVFSAHCLHRCKANDYTVK